MQGNGLPAPEPGAQDGASAERTLFPLVRHLSERVTPALVRLPLTPNQITFASLLAGLAAAACYLDGDRLWAVVGGVLFVISYVLDNCDGEVARLKNMQSQFGADLDTFADWLTHTALFLALGFTAERAFAEDLWFWFGVAAAAGCTINYAVVRLLDRMRGAGIGEDDTPHARDGESPAFSPLPKAPKELFIYVFREIFRADFCFILLALSAFDLAWALLPFGAVGAQVYWLTVFVKGARDYHV